MKFAEFNLESSLQAAIDQSGYAECTPIQSAVIPLILEGKDISGLAQTGTGKTAAFLIPLMERILRGRAPLPEGLSDEDKEIMQKRAFTDWRSQNFILILVPTRELAEQVYENMAKLSVVSGLRGISVYGGTSYDKQKEGFKSGVEFVVATPGRLIDLYKENVVDLKQVRGIVFDEADRMFDMGFKDDMKYILQRVPKERQFLVFSATLNFDVLNTAYQFGAEPVEINVSRDQAKAENVKDTIYHVGNNDKPQALLSLLKKQTPKQVIVFSNFKMNVERLAAFLSSNGYPAMAISSLLSQAQRNRVIELFKSENEQNILVATDVAARGLDIKGVDMVVNYELPQDAESYVHRIGRTGRAGAEGTAISLVSDRDVESLGRIEDYLKHKIEVGWMDDADLIKDFKRMPDDSYSGFRSNRGEGRPNRDGGGPRSSGGGPGGGRGGPGGGRGGNDRNRSPRGPRPEGEAREARGPRPEGAPGEGRPRRDGPRPAGAGPRAEGGPRRDGGGPRPEGGRPQSRPVPRGAQAANGNGGPKPVSPIKPVQRGANGQIIKPVTNTRVIGAKVHPKAAQKSITQKVSGFFKKLFGN